MRLYPEKSMASVVAIWQGLLLAGCAPSGTQPAKPTDHAAITAQPKVDAAKQTDEIDPARELVLIESGARYRIGLNHAAGDAQNYGGNQVDYRGEASIIVRDTPERPGTWEIGLRLSVRIKESQAIGSKNSDGTRYEAAGYKCLVAGIPASVSKDGVTWHGFSNNKVYWKNTSVDTFATRPTEDQLKEMQKNNIEPYPEGDWTYRPPPGGVARLDQQWIFDGTPDRGDQPFGEIALNEVRISLRIPAATVLNLTPLVLK